MSYSIKEVFYTLQGEGAPTGRPSVFCRFSGCNLCSGREEDRAEAVCSFCDTDFVAARVVPATRMPRRSPTASPYLSPEGEGSRFAVCTGGEPLSRRCTSGFEIAIETYGTIALPPRIDRVCVSPKAGAGLVVTSGDELKVVVPQPRLDPLDFAQLDFRRFSVQPIDGPGLNPEGRAANTEWAIRFCLARPQWQLSLQTHKVTGVR